MLYSRLIIIKRNHVLRTRHNRNACGVGGTVIRICQGHEQQESERVKPGPIGNVTIWSTVTEALSSHMLCASVKTEKRTSWRSALSSYHNHQNVRWPVDSFKFTNKTHAVKKTEHEGLTGGECDSRAWLRRRVVRRMRKGLNEMLSILEISLKETRRLPTVDKGLLKQWATSAIEQWRSL
jgi:hypothetical protein